MEKKEGEKIIIGIDPGTQLMGYGLILVKGKKVSVVQYGVIHLAKYSNHALKLKKIFERVSQLVEEYLPDEMALEAPFMGKNVQAALKLGRAQGVAMSAALVRQIPIAEYAPRKVKQSVTGSGNASKEQVARMLEKQLNFTFHENDTLDASDALGVALCHYFQGKLGGMNKAKSWGSFLKDNPNRIAKK
ncbi:crossover junction endodeoxyribonuclease RuvC [Microscilla marina]|uniref:Crossover junction endodeoxyribonuclease RuvC n=1 Tax=Microscilla marina ATCC 23134 TaxID=313606 RepID=A1ZZ63_MICM2|nr:crossover junction endodeoxyribonuclease RuvC [Microscilla marina]EAY24322.1 crossover junction endodeoxyribonuclease RuvC [Microscilla marina ATCC 23134]